LALVFAKGIYIATDTKLVLWFWFLCCAMDEKIRMMAAGRCFFAWSIITFLTQSYGDLA